MSAMTETAHRLQQQTVLYVPSEAMSMPIDMASKNKELSARLESAMIHWINQIKEATNAQSFEDPDDMSGPLDEIAFWRARSNFDEKIILAMQFSLIIMFKLLNKFFYQAKI